MTQDINTRVAILKASGNITSCENGPPYIYTIVIPLKDTCSIVHRETQALIPTLSQPNPGNDRRIGTSPMQVLHHQDSYENWTESPLYLGYFLNKRTHPARIINTFFHQGSRHSQNTPLSTQYDYLSGIANHINTQSII